MILFLVLLALLAAGTAVMVVQLTDPAPGRHAAAETRVWPVWVRGVHAGRPVVDTADVPVLEPALAEAVA